MAEERVVERVREPATTTVVERGGSGVGGILIGLAVLIVIAIAAYFLLAANRNDAIRTDAVNGAARSVSHAADNVADAAQRASPPSQ